MTGASADAPSGMKVARSRMPSKTMRTGSTFGLATAALSSGFVASAALASPSDEAGLAAGVLSSGSGLFGGAPGVVVLKRSRKASSRYFGVCGRRSMRTILTSSLRCEVSNSRYLPSGDQATSPPSPLARKLTGWACPPAAGATQMLRNDRRSVTPKASQRESGDQATRELSKRSGRR
jgi:hypothetical protein